LCRTALSRGELGPKQEAGDASLRRRRPLRHRRRWGIPPSAGAGRRSATARLRHARLDAVAVTIPVAITPAEGLLTLASRHPVPALADRGVAEIGRADAERLADALAHLGGERVEILPQGGTGRGGGIARGLRGREVRNGGEGGEQHEPAFRGRTPWLMAHRAARVGARQVPPHGVGPSGSVVQPMRPMSHSAKGADSVAAAISQRPRRRIMRFLPAIVSRARCAAVRH
jgi:hypothetical protein